MKQKWQHSTNIADLEKRKVYAIVSVFYFQGIGTMNKVHGILTTNCLISGEKVDEKLEKRKIKRRQNRG